MQITICRLQLEMFESADLPPGESFGSLASKGFKAKISLAGNLIGMYKPNEQYAGILKVYTVFDSKALKEQKQTLVDYCDRLFGEYLTKYKIKFRSTYYKDKKFKKIFYHILDNQDKTLAVISIDRNKPIRPRYVDKWKHYDLLPQNFDLIEFVVEDIKATLAHKCYIY